MYKAYSSHGQSNVRVTLFTRAYHACGATEPEAPVG